MAFWVAPECVDMTARANIQMQKAGAELVCEYAGSCPLLIWSVMLLFE